MPHTLILIDGHSLAFRAFYGMQRTGLRTSSGEPTYAVYGFATILLNLLTESPPPDYVALSFDVGHTFRHDIFPAYKSGRAETPAEFHPQLERIKQLVTALGIPIYVAQTYEADDVIGTLTCQATQHNIHTTILTGDTDTLQLVNDHVRVLLAQPHNRSMESVLYDEQQVIARYNGLQPHQLADLRGLKGDSSDAIPGIKGIGEKGAIALLTQFGTIERLYEHLEEVPARYRKLLAGQREQALFSRNLARIVLDVPVTLDTTRTCGSGCNQHAVVQLLQTLEFRKLLEKITQHSDIFGVDVSSDTTPTTTVETAESIEPQAEFGTETDTSPDGQMSLFNTADNRTLLPPPLGTYAAITDMDALHALCARLDTAHAFAFDTETTGKNPITSDLVGISLAIEPGTAWYIPVGHRHSTQLPRKHVFAALAPYFANPAIAKYCHNAKYDMMMLDIAGLPVVGITFDTMIAAGLLGKRMRLKDLAFHEQIVSHVLNIEDLIGTGKQQRTFDTVAIEDAVNYAAADADMTLQLQHRLAAALATEPQIQHLFTTVEMPLIPILATMERNGIALDTDHMRELSKRIHVRFAELEHDIYNVAGKRFNINSSMQLREILFERLNIPTTGVSKTAKGQYSLRADVLDKLHDRHDIVPLILEHRHLAKLLTTYVDVLPTLINPHTKRIHTSFNQMGTATGRLASNSPNLQNIPVRTDIGGEIRRGFIASPGCLLISADYSQIELRVLAHVTGDANLVRSFNEGLDIHAAMASHLFDIPLEEVDKQQRRIAKTTVFGIIYGISSFGLSQRTELNRTEAQAVIDSFFARFPQVRTYLDHTLATGRTTGAVESFFGRRRMMPDLLGKGAQRQAAEREAINMPIQSTAADIMKMAMIDVHCALQQHHLQTRMVLQVHDELIFDAPHNERDTVIHVVRQAMEGACQLNVPLSVDIEVGDNWGQMHAI